MSIPVNENEPTVNVSLGMVGGVLLLSAIMWTPILIINALQQAELRDHAKQTMGEVVGYCNFRRKHPNCAKVRYEVHNKTYWNSISGPGAAAERLPLGSKIPVFYTEKWPQYSNIAIAEADSTDGPGWYGVIAIWGAGFLCIGGSWWSRRRKLLAKQ